MDVAAVTGMVGNFDDDQLEEAMGMSLAGSAAVSAVGSEDEADLRRGPWSLEEDVLLVNYIAKHGEGRWNSLARSAGLKRTGKSCRLRWLNYLRPDVRRGNITPEEQLLILELHSRWGNRWSKIAQHLPGRTDNEIKNYWRTRVQKHAKQLRCEVNSRQFRDVVRFVWMPRLVERIQAEAGAGGAHDAAAMAVGVLAPATTVSAPAACQMSASAYSRQSGAPLNEQAAHQCRNHEHTDYSYNESAGQTAAAMSPDDTSSALRSTITAEASHAQHQQASTTTTPTNEGGGVMQCGGAATDDVVVQEDVFGFGGSWSDLLATTGCGESMISLPDFELGDFEDNVWSQEDLGLHQQHWS